MIGSHPSEMLARLSNTVHRWEVEGRQLGLWLPVAERTLNAEPASASSPHAMSPRQLMRDVQPAMDLCDELVIPDTQRLTTMLRAIHLLDEWHEPLEDASALVDRTADHILAEDNLRQGFGYSGNDELGMIIPRRCPGIKDAPDLNADLPNAALHFVTYVPRVVDAGHPDEADLRARGRTVQLRHLPSSRFWTSAHPVIADEPLLAVAPVHQNASDARVRRIGNPERYGLEVLAGRKRLSEIVRRAIDGDVDVLFLPEMAVDEADLTKLSSIIRTSGSAFLRSHGRLSNLRFVVAGCVSPPTATERGRNYIVVLDHLGTILLRQHKLTRWNLKAHHQRNYGITDGFDPEAPQLPEDIEPGQEIWVADLPPLGRLATLICADLAHDMPGDFLVRNVALDWLHAPIMDRTNVVVHSTGATQPWVVERAFRAASNGARRVIVTNSLLFTSLINVVNSRPGSAYPPYAACNFALLVDGEGGLTYRNLSTGVPASGTIVELARWKDGFNS